MVTTITSIILLFDPMITKTIVANHTLFVVVTFSKTNSFDYNVWSFLTLPHLLDCLICTRNSVSIVLLLWMMGGWERWGLVGLHHGVGGGGGGTECRYYLIVCFYLWFCLLVSHVLFLFSVSREHDSYCVCFFVYCFLSLSPVPLTGSYWGIEIVVSVMQHYL